jgi:hypothetical protein
MVRRSPGACANHTGVYVLLENVLKYTVGKCIEI